MQQQQRHRSTPVKVVVTGHHHHHHRHKRQSSNSPKPSPDLAVTINAKYNTFTVDLRCAAVLFARMFSLQVWRKDALFECLNRLFWSADFAISGAAMTTPQQANLLVAQLLTLLD